jgi:hypothetical protein
MGGSEETDQERSCQGISEDTSKNVLPEGKFGRIQN